jgi:hypothetical protein
MLAHSKSIVLLTKIVEKLRMDYVVEGDLSTKDWFFKLFSTLKTATTSV